MRAAIRPSPGQYATPRAVVRTPDGSVCRHISLPVSAAPDARAPFRPLTDLIGTWKGLGTPEGNREEKQRGHWQEGHEWQWQFKDDQAWLRFGD